MKYTYQISFNGSDYSELIPGQSIQLEGDWIDGTMIFRENISELKITKFENSTIYDTLEEWFSDSTKFGTRIFVKILNNNIQESLHWFGVKWGTLNKELKTYTVQPIVYDNWGVYFESTIDTSETINVSDYGDNNYFIYENYVTYTTKYIGETVNNSDYSINTLYNRGKQLIANYTDWNVSDYVSSFINDDDYEDGSSIATEYGINLDYVRGDQTMMQYAGAFWPVKQSLNDYFESLKLFNIYPFFDSNDQLRVEHLKFFIDKLEDNAVNLSDYFKDYDDEFEYNNPELYILDNINMTVNENNQDEDFNGASVVYSDKRSRQDAGKRDFQSIFISDLEYNINASDYIDTRNTLFSAAPQRIYDTFIYALSNGSVITMEKNYLNATNFAVSGTARFQTNAFNVTGGVFIRIVTTSISGTVNFTLYDSVTVGSISNTITVNSTGTTTGTLTPIRVEKNACLRIELPLNAAFNGYYIIEYASGTDYVVPIKEGYISGEEKPNALFSVANIFEDYWKDNGLSRSATYSGKSVTFNNTEYNLRRKDVRFHYPSVINPLFGINDGERIGKVAKWTRDLDTDYYTLSLIYQEDE